MSNSDTSMPEQGPGAATTSSGSTSILAPLAPVIDGRPADFLRLPRELRDKVYAYLLSTEYTKYEYGKPNLDPYARGFLRSCDYRYHFHTSILYTNRQISSEANQTLYNDNLFVYVYYSDLFDRALYSKSVWHQVLGRAPKIKHHAMKIFFLAPGEYLVSGNPDIITCNELPAICRSLLVEDRFNFGFFTSVKLRLVLCDEVGNGSIKAEEEEEEEEVEDTGHRIIESPGNLTAIDEKISTVSSRVSRLLEPFRQLHSIRDPQIIGPVPYGYRVRIIGEIGKLPPSDQERFDHVLNTYKEAIQKFDSENFVSLNFILRDMLAEIRDARGPHRGFDQTEIVTGPFAGHTAWKVYNIIEFDVWTKLAWACIKIGDFTVARYWRQHIVLDLSA